MHFLGGGGVGGGYLYFDNINNNNTFIQLQSYGPRCFTVKSSIYIGYMYDIKKTKQTNSMCVGVGVGVGGGGGGGGVELMMMMMSWCLMSSDVIWHIRDKLWPMPKHGSIKSSYVRCMRV